jgi:hypothetical protein
VRKLFAAALAASLSVSSPGWAQQAASSSIGQEPARLQLTPSTVAGAVMPSANQRLADAVAATLNHTPQLKQFRVNISVQDGHVSLSGTVLTQAQRAEVLRSVQAIPGVICVHDQLRVVTPGDIVPAQALPALPALPLQQQAGGGQPKVIGQPKGKTPEVVPPPMNPNPMLPVPPFAPGVGPAVPGQGAGPGALGQGGILEPMPLQGAPPGFPSANQPPPMPPYAWPTYAPYNNYSRVAYPNLYPYESFPFIGPIYPFPKIPLGWRSVNLTWEDGHWWLGRNATGHDWWRVRYW